jgi:hypothetical protein
MSTVKYSEMFLWIILVSEEDFLNLTIHALHSFKMLVTTYQLTQCNIPEDLNLQQQYSENLKFCMCNFALVLNYRIFSNLIRIRIQSTLSFWRFLKRKKLVRGSKLHLSFNHPLPTGRLIE